MSIIKPFFNKTSNKTRGIGIFLVLLIMTIISCPSADSDSGSSSSSGGGSGGSEDLGPLVAVSVKLIAGSGTEGTPTNDPEKTGADAKFNFPQGIAVDTDGNIYVADRLNHSIRKITPEGTVSTYAGKSGTAGNAEGALTTTARFTNPMDVLLKDADTFYVLDDKGIRQIDKKTATVTTHADLTTAKFSITGGNQRSIVRKPNTETFYILISEANTNHDSRVIEHTGGTTFNILLDAGTAQTGAGLNTSHTFSDAVFDSAGNMYVSTGDSGHAIITFNPSTAGKTNAGYIQAVAFFVGSTSNVTGYANGVGTVARFDQTRGMLIRGDYIYVADSKNHVIRMIQISTKTVTTMVGLAGTAGQVNGGKDVATFNEPTDLEFAPNGDIIVSEKHAIRRIVVQK